MRHEPGLYIKGYAWSQAAQSWLQDHGKDTPLFKSKAIPIQFQKQLNGDLKGSVSFQENFEISLSSELPSTQPQMQSRPIVGRSISRSNNDYSRLKVSFGPARELERMFGGSDVAKGSQSAGTLQDCSWTHQVEAYATDTIGVFLEKLATASLQLTQYWSKRPTGQTHAKRYEDFIASVSSPVLMVYDSANNPAQMRKPWSLDEYTRVYAAAIDDIEQWEPLDPACTFDQYAERFGFAGPPGSFPPLLRIEEENESLRERSHRYRRYKQQQQSAIPKIEELNNDRQAFGWAQYYHSKDGGSGEWRPCIARPDGSGKRTFKISWAFTPSCSTDSQKQVFDESSVLLAPSDPDIFSASSPEHQEYLAGAQQLRAEGKSDREIASVLNGYMEQKLKQSSSASSLSQRPPPITPGIVRKYLQRSGA
jgi:hypothetical protein